MHEHSLTEKWNFMVLTALQEPLSNVLRLIEERTLSNMNTAARFLRPRHVTGTLFHLLEEYEVIDSQRRLTPFGKILANARDLLGERIEIMKNGDHTQQASARTLTVSRNKSILRATLAFYHQVLKSTSSISREILTLYQHAILSLSRLPDRDQRIDSLGTVSLPLDVLITTFIKHGDSRSPSDLMEWIKEVQSRHPSQVYFEYQKERSRYQYINIMAPIKE